MMRPSISFREPRQRGPETLTSVWLSENLQTGCLSIGKFCGEARGQQYVQLWKLAPRLHRELHSADPAWEADIGKED